MPTPMTQEDQPTVEGLMALVREHVNNAYHHGMPAFESSESVVLAYAHRLASAQAPAPQEAMFLVCAGGDNYSSEIVPASKLDEAYLLTQWCALDRIDADQHRAALEHFHDPDEWTYMDPLQGGRNRVAVEFSISFEDGWVRVVRLPAAPTPEGQK